MTLLNFLESKNEENAVLSTKLMMGVFLRAYTHAHTRQSLAELLFQTVFRSPFSKYIMESGHSESTTNDEFSSSFLFFSSLPPFFLVYHQLPRNKWQPFGLLNRRDGANKEAEEEGRASEKNLEISPFNEIGKNARNFPRFEVARRSGCRARCSRSRSMLLLLFLHSCLSKEEEGLVTNSSVKKKERTFFSSPLSISLYCLSFFSFVKPIFRHTFAKKWIFHNGRR